MHNTHSSGRRVLVASKAKEVLVAGFEVLELDADSASMLAIVINKEIAETLTSFLTVLSIKLNNDLFYYSCNM